MKNKKIEICKSKETKVMRNNKVKCKALFVSIITWIMVVTGNAESLSNVEDINCSRFNNFSKKNNIETIAPNETSESTSFIESDDEIVVTTIIPEHDLIVRQVNASTKFGNLKTFVNPLIENKSGKHKDKNNCNVFESTSECIQTEILDESYNMDTTETEETTVPIIDSTIDSEPSIKYSEDESMESCDTTEPEDDSHSTESSEESYITTAIVEESYIVDTTTEYNGPVLNKRNGTIMGPSGKETYYNLNMSKVVAGMRNLGYSEESYPYWVREDGVKMLGDYVMVAANLKIRPKGTILLCSLGEALVCDTGGFAKRNTYQLDVAVNW